MANGTTVRLTAQAAAGWKFLRWQLDCARTAGPVCSLRMTANRRVVATFAPRSGGPLITTVPAA